jgi:hypothetical protein
MDFSFKHRRTAETPDGVVPSPTISRAGLTPIGRPYSWFDCTSATILFLVEQDDYVRSHGLGVGPIAPFNGPDGVFVELDAFRTGPAVSSFGNELSKNLYDLIYNSACLFDISRYTDTDFYVLA